LLTAPELNANRKSYRTSQTLGQAGNLPAVSPNKYVKKRVCLTGLFTAHDPS